MKATVIAAAIAIAHPSIPRATARAYADILRLDPQPILLIALIRHESDFNPHAQGGLDGQCIGLAQRCLRFEPACRDGYDAPACAARRDALLDGPTALRLLVSEARAWRRLCGRLWLNGYTGSGSVAAPCGRGRPRVVRDIEKIERRLRRR